MIPNTIDPNKYCIFTSNYSFIDNDGYVDALADGLLLLRHLFAMEDDSLTHGAVGHMAVRKTKHEIKSHLNKYMPKKRNKTATD